MWFRVISWLLKHLQETSKKAVLSQIEQADKFQEVGKHKLPDILIYVLFQEEIVELALKDIGLI